MTLRELRINAGRSITKLAQEAGVSRTVVKNAELGRPVRADTVKSIVDALGRVLGREILVSEIEGLNVM